MEKNKIPAISTKKILLMMFAGFFGGLFLNYCFSAEFNVQLVESILGPLGDIFIRAIKMVVVPLVFFSLVLGTASLKDIRKIGKIGSKITLFYIATTALAISFALIIANVMGPGTGAKLDLYNTPQKRLAALIDNFAKEYPDDFIIEKNKLKEINVKLLKTDTHKMKIKHLKNFYEREIINNLSRISDFIYKKSRAGKFNSQARKKISEINDELNSINEEIKQLKLKLKKSPGFVKVLLDIVPANPVKAMAEGKMLQIIFFSILIGITITLLPEKKMYQTIDFFENGSEIFLTMINLIMLIAPLGVFILIARVIAIQGTDVITKLFFYMLTMVLAYLFQIVFVYGSIIKFMIKVPVIKFLKKFYGVIVVAFSTSSSNATIPVNLEVCEHKLGISNKICSFTIPFGATVNMDGTAMMQGVAAIFVSQLYNIDLDLSSQIQIILTATLASIGTAGVPGVGLIMLAMVFQQVGLPLESIGILWSVDRILDMCRTAVNVTGDAVGTLWIGISENEFNKDIFDSE